MGNTPNVRFKGFTEDWEQRKLSDISDVRDGTHDSPKYLNTGHPFVTSKNVKDGFINYDEIQYISDEDFNEINKRSKVDVNDILMGMIGTIGNMALIRTEPDFAIKNVALIKDTKQINHLYLYHFLHSSFIEKQLSFGVDGGTQKFVSLGNIRNLDIVYPSEAEQIKLGDYFEQLDNLITLHQQKYDETKEFKKYMLQNMFPQKDEKVPKIRFDGFTGNWEQRKLSDIVDVLDGDRGKNYPTSDDFDISGHTLFLNASNVTNDGFLFQDNQFITEEKSNSMGNGKLEDDDIVVTSRGSLGHIAWYNADISSFVSYARINSGMLILRNKKEVETEYLYHFMKSSKGQSQISFISFGSAQPQLTKKGVEDLEVILPKRRDEQVQLGYYFSNLDHLITLQQQKCNALKEFKKYMLQNMFPQKGENKCQN